MCKRELAKAREQRTKAWKFKNSTVCWGERPAVHYSQNIVSVKRLYHKVGQRPDWRCLRLQRGSAFVLESMQGPLSGLKGGGTWSDGCLRKMTLAAVCIQDSKPFYS